MEFISIRRDELNELRSIGRENTDIKNEISVRTNKIGHHNQER